MNYSLTRHGLGLIRIVFDYSPRLIAVMRRLRGAWYSRIDNTPGWICPVNPYNISILRGAFSRLDAALTPPEEGKAIVLPKNRVDLTCVRAEDIPVKGLHPYQVEGVAFLESLGGRGLIADEMGLGKTLQALAWSSLNEKARPVLVVCPASVKLHWKRQIHKWLGKPSVYICRGRKPPEKMPAMEFFIINYDILNGWADFLKHFNIKLMILDEVHYIKSRTAKRTKAVQGLAGRIKYLIGLTGTPAKNRPADIFHPIQLIQPGVLPSWWNFITRYCGAKFNGYGWDYSGATNTKELHTILTHTVMIRRTKEQVMKDLPPITRSMMPMEIDDRDEYNLAEQDFRAWAKEQKNVKITKEAIANALSRLEILKQLCVRLKMPMMIEWIRDFLANDEKLVIFCTHKWTVGAIMQAFQPVAVRIEGDTKEEARDKNIRLFCDRGKVRLLVANIVAGGVGIDGLQGAANNLAFAELAWTPADHDQAESRLHRIGQKGAVTAWYLVAPNTVEDRIVSVLDSKQKVISSLVDGKESKSDSTMMEILKGYQDED